MDYPSNDEYSRQFGGHVQKYFGFFRFMLTSRFKSCGLSLLTNLCFLGRRGTQRRAHCWFQRLSRASDIAAGDVASGPFSAVAVESCSKQEMERKERESDSLPLALLFPKSIFACNPYRNSLSASFRQRLNL